MPTMGPDEIEEPERSPVLPGVRASLADAKLGEQDGAAAALALRYAELLDDAAVERQYTKAVERIDRVVAGAADNMSQVAGQQVLDSWDRIRSALAEHSTASDMGPKLLATLTALGLTPAGRAAKGSKEQPSASVSTLPSPLQVLREQARERRAGAS